jgi:hypothetical protein
MKHSVFFKKGVLSRTVLPLFFALCLAAGMFSGCDTGVGGYTSPPDVPVIQSVSITSNFTQESNSEEEKTGTITVTWGAVSGAASYEVYYAPKNPDTPTIPATPAKTITGTSATITAAGIGYYTMNYYVWVKAINTGGTSAPSAPASTLDRFMGTWTASYGDYYYITNADVLYDMGGFGYLGYIRAIVPFNNGASVDFNNHNGPAGVIIIEYDDDYMGSSGWTWAGAPNYFNAVYYYGLSGSGEGATAYLGAAADLPGGPEVDDVDEAIAKFTFTDKDEYIVSGVAAEYAWEAYP